MEPDLEMCDLVQQRSSSEEEELKLEYTSSSTDHSSQEEEEKKKKQKLEQINSDSSPEEEELKLEYTTSSTDHSSQEEEEKKKKQKLEQINSDSSPEEEEEKKNKQKLEEISSDDDSCFEEDSDTDLSDCDCDEDRIKKETKTEKKTFVVDEPFSIMLSEEERLNIQFNPADYSSTEERDKAISDFFESEKAYEEEEARRREERKKKFELYEDKRKSHGWYGIVMADDSDEYSDAEDRAEDLRKYHQQVKNSGGFDVEHFPKARLCGMITPVEVDGSGSREDEPLLGKLSCTSIRKFNRDRSRAYRFKRVIKSTSRCCAGFVYYITFEATEADSTTTFETSVYLKIGDKVQIMKIEPKDDLKGQ